MPDQLLEIRGLHVVYQTDDATVYALSLIHI